MTMHWHYRGNKKEELKRWVFRHFLKAVSDGANVTFCGTVFHSWEAKTREIGHVLKSPSTKKLLIAENVKSLNLHELLWYTFNYWWWTIRRCQIRTCTIAHTDYNGTSPELLNKQPTTRKHSLQQRIFADSQCNLRGILMPYQTTHIRSIVLGFQFIHSYWAGSNSNCWSQKSIKMAAIIYKGKKEIMAEWFSYS